jgi:hypothetical protein
MCFGDFGQDNAMIRAAGKRQAMPGLRHNEYLPIYLAQIEACTVIKLQPPPSPPPPPQLPSSLPPALSACLASDFSQVTDRYKPTLREFLLAPAQPLLLGHWPAWLMDG